MAAALPFVTSGLGAVSSIFGGAKPQKSSSQFQQTQTQTQELDPKQRRMNKQVFKKLIDLIRQGPTVSQGDRDTARAQNNAAFNQAGQNLEATLAARGFGNSGKMGSGYRSLDIDRAKNQGSIEAQLRNEAMNRFQQWIQNAFQFNTPRSATTTSSGTSSSVGPPQMNPFSGAGNALGDLSSLMYMRNMTRTPSPSGGGGNMSWLDSYVQ